ncbi:phage tail protein [Mucilaginibacter sp. RCC_168]|jgi:microcystin-dependent protein|uniref:phage tail protein n=1 Tax=Mucilaginibacter sp. RCC_168 TaxID=3239221 RepID=UPI003524A36A
MESPFIGTISLFAGNFAPRGWALCDGQLLSISTNQALFSLVGTAYGGDGVRTFALPDLRGRAPIHQGQGRGLSPRNWGESAGEENVTLLIGQMPAHNHALNASTNTGDKPSPTINVMAVSSDPDVGGAPLNFVSGASVNTAMAPNAIGPAGGTQPHDNMQPYLAVTFIIALEGIYPARN